MKNNKIHLLFILSICHLYSIGQSTNLILTSNENIVWLDSLKKLSIENQISIIKMRILQDTLVYNTKQHRSNRVLIENVKREQKLKDLGIESDGRILFFVRHVYKPFQVEFIPFYWNNWTKIDKIKAFHKFLDCDKIESIEIICDEDKEISLFGSMAGYGVIIFDLKRKKYVRKFNRLLDE